MKKIIIINIFFILAILLIGEIIIRNKDQKEYLIEQQIKHEYFYENNDNTYDFIDDSEHFHLRLPSYFPKEQNKDSILLAGCSFTFGNNLQYKDTSGYILSNYIDKSVYNFGIDGGSPREFLYLMRSKLALNILLKDKNNIKTVIYTYITDQNPRLYTNVYRKSPAFKLRNNHLKYYKQNCIHLKFRLLMFIEKYIAYKLISSNCTYKLLFTYMKEINKEIKKNFGKDTQFVILVYEDRNNYDWTIFEKEGIKIIRVNDIVSVDIKNPEYTVDNWHPNGKAWEVIVPGLAKELNL